MQTLIRGGSAKRLAAAGALAVAGLLSLGQTYSARPHSLVSSWMPDPYFHGWGSDDAGLWGDTVAGTNPRQWRACIRLGDPAYQVEVEGTMVEVSLDGVTWTRYPSKRLLPSVGQLVIAGELPPGVTVATLTFRVSYIDALGLPSDPFVVWDDDYDWDTPDVPLAVDVPASDTTPPAAPSDVTAELQPDGVLLSWTSVFADAFGYAVERSIDGGAFASLTPELVRDGDQVGFRDAAPVPGAQHRYQVWTEDTAGLRSAAPSAIVTVDVP